MLEAITFGGSIVRRCLTEAFEDTNGSHDGEGHETGEDVPHGSGVGPVVGMEIGLNREVNRQENYCEEGAAEPGKIAVQEVHRLRASFGSQPVALIGKIDELRWQQLEEERDAESEHRGKNANADQHAEKGRFCLPAVRDAARVEVRNYDLWQLRVQGRKMKCRAHGQQSKDKFRRV